MRVLFVGTNPGGGGTESHFISLARSLADAGHEIIAAVRPDDFIHRGLADHPRVRLVPAEFRSRRDLRTIRELSCLMRSLRPDWVVGAFKAEYWGLAVAAKLAGVRLVLFSHLDQRIRPAMVHDFARLVRGIVVPSEYLRRRTIERGVRGDLVAVLPNPIDVDRFTVTSDLRARARHSLGLGDDDLVVGYVGRFEPAKGVMTLASALGQTMARIPRLHALWVGHGKSESELRSLTSATCFESRHHWLPWLDDVSPAYAAMDMLALPSEGSETFGRVLVEAQACGVPVLGARNGGIPEALFEDRTGWLVAPGDVPAWDRAIELLAGNDARRHRFAERGRRFALQFDSRRIAEKFPRVLASFDGRPVVESP